MTSSFAYPVDIVQDKLRAGYQLKTLDMVQLRNIVE